MEAASTPDASARDIERYHAALLELADEARRIVQPALEHGFNVETKPDRSPVTDVDRAVERRWRELIDRWFPDHGVLGEEYPPTRPASAFQWIMDPIDGTEEFVHGIPTFGTMLALHHRGVPLVGSSITRRSTSASTPASGWGPTGTAGGSGSTTPPRARGPRRCGSS